MNLLQNLRTINNDDTINPFNIRKSQYEQIEEFCSIFIESLSKLGKNYLTLYKIEKKEIVSYLGCNNSLLTEYTIYADNNGNKENVFLTLLLPTLLHNNFFQINGTLYTPALYAVDYPIVIKDKSLKLSSLCNSITINYKIDFIVFLGNNIPLSYFLLLFLNNSQEDKDLLDNFTNISKIKIQQLTENNIIVYFNKIFKSNSSTLEEIQQTFDSIFLDSYYKKLYRVCYPELKNICLHDILFKSINDICIDAIPLFIDLSKKRIIFTETLFTPLFKRVFKTCKILLSGHLINKLNIDPLLIVKYFNSSNNEKKKTYGLSNNRRYDTANLYDVISINKLNMIQPGVKNPPSTISGIHDSFRGRICPITVSSQKPGEVVSLTNETTFDEFGRIII